MKRIIAILICAAMISCGSQNASDSAARMADSSAAPSSPSVVEPPADTAGYDMPVQRRDTGGSDMPVVNPIDPNVQPK